MKKHCLLPILIFLFCQTNAATIDVQTAQTVALNFFKVTTGNNTNITATLKYTRLEDGNMADFYIFDISPAKGFVIVAGNDNTTPVIGYSTETNFTSDVNHKNGISYWMDHVAARINKSAQLNVQANARITYMWGAYLNGQNPNASRSAGVTPLLTTTWDQSPNYNALCPTYVPDNQQAVTGCVATAMAQIMKYWGYPTRGRGSYTYVDSTPAFSYNYGRLSANFDTVFNWAQMPASISSTNMPIALLMYDCGVSVAMDYGDENQGGSGAWVLQVEAGTGQPCSQYAYVHYFYYNPNTIQGIVKSQYAQNDFLNLIENDLNNGRVVQYEGDDTSGAGGHTWVCDGYQTNDMLHMNWGWGGSNNGYFAIANLDAGTYNFDDAEAALIGIEPISPINVVATAVTQNVCPGNTTTLTAQGPASATFSWVPTTGLSCPTCATTTLSPAAANEIYTVTADSAGVKGSATIAISIVQPVSAAFNANTTATCAAPTSIPFTNLSANGNNYLWSFGDGTTDTATNPVHTYNAYGSYNVSLISYNTCGADTVLHNQAVQVTDQAPVIAGQSICTGNSATLTATGTGYIQWYDAPTGGNLITTGTTYTTPVLNATTTYYVYSFIAPPANAVGPNDNSFGGGGYFTGSNDHGNIFNCTKAQILDSVDVYAQTAGSRTITLEDSDETVLSSVTVNIPVGKSTVALGLSIPIENKLKLALKGNTYVYRNNAGANYPYTSTDGTITITNSDAGTPGYFYYFYNWKLQQPGCTTATTVVPVTVLNGSNNTIHVSFNGTIVNFTAAPGITTCSWDFGDGTNSSQLNVSHNYSSIGNYTVVLIETNGTCTDTVTQLISLYPAGINTLNNVEVLSLFPNPATNQLNVNISSNTDIAGLKLIAYNTLGQTELERNVQLQNGNNTFILDITTLSSGVHILSFQNGKTVINRRFVKAD